MEFAFTDDQLTLTQAAREMLVDSCQPADLRRLLESQQPRDDARWATINEMGLIGMLAPEGAGGMGMTLTDFIGIAEAAGYVGLPEPLVELTGITLPLLAQLADNHGWLDRAMAGAIVAIGHPVNPLVADADTETPMTKRPDLGPILAIAAAAVAGVAIIAGFIIVGGPGNARDRRLDDLTTQKIGQIVGVAQCAFDASGVAPIDYPTAAKTRSLPPAPNLPPAFCDSGIGVQLTVGAGDAPAAPGDITYQDVGPTEIRICANFHTQQTRDEGAQVVLPYSDIYPTLADPHPAGVHCYVLALVKSGVPFDGTPPGLPPERKNLQ